MSNQTAPELQEFQLLSKCLGGLIGPYAEEDPAVKAARTKVALETVQRMQTLLTRHRSVGHVREIKLPGSCHCVPDWLHTADNTTVSNEPPLVTKGDKQVSVDAEQTGRHQLASVKLLDFVENCLLNATSQHIPGWVVLSSKRPDDHDGLSIQLQSVSAQTMPPQADESTRTGPPVQIKLSIQPA